MAVNLLGEILIHLIILLLKVRKIVLLFLEMLLVIKIRLLGLVKSLELVLVWLNLSIHILIPRIVLNI